MTSQPRGPGRGCGTNKADRRDTRANPTDAIPVFEGEAFRVTVGANMGDGLSDRTELQPDEIYMLDPRATRERISLHLYGDGRMEITPGTK